MTPEELMKPRYKVIGDYPFSCLRVGYIITEPIPIINQQALQGGKSEFDFIEKYPDVFKKLEWWEEREQYFWSDGYPSTPLFVSNIGGTIFGSAWGIDKLGFFTLEVNGSRTKGHLTNFIPATHEQYINPKQ